MFNVYKPSGSVGVLTWPLLLVGILLMVALAFLYQLLLEWIPFIYVNVLMTLGMGLAAGMTATFVIKTGHCRSLLLATLIGLSLGTTALVAKFLWQYRAAFNAGLFESFPEHILRRVNGGWMVGRGNGAPLSGMFVYLVWLIEAGIVFYFGWTMSRAAAKEPYSEKMNLWADEAESVMLLPITSEEMVHQIKSATSVEELLEIPIPKTDESAKVAQYIVNSIPGQEMEDAYLTVKTIEYSINKKGEQETKETTLVENAVLSSENRVQLVENAELLNEAMNEFRASEQAERLAARAAGGTADAESVDEGDVI